MLNTKVDCQDMSLCINLGNVYIEKSKLKSKLEKSSEDLLKLNQELSDKIQQFVAFIDKFYYPKKLTKTFHEFYRHQIKDIIAELEKQGVRTRIPETMELIDLFDYFKDEIDSLQNLIKTKQDEIDYIVSSLYSKTRDDISQKR